MTSESCELMAMKAAKHFKSEARFAKKVSVGIIVPGLAKITNVQP